MDFNLSEEQKDVQKAASDFAQGEFDPELALELDKKGAFPESIWKKACQLGFIGLHYPETFGGQGLGLFENLLVVESFCRVESGIGSALSMVNLGAEILLNYGSQDQKNTFLPPLSKGEKRMCTAFAESEDERDLSSILTMAEKKGEEYVIRGKKPFVLMAPLADVFVILCKDSSDGVSTFLVEKQRETVQIHPIEKMGLKMVPYGDLHLKEVCVPLHQRIGKGNDGMIHADQYFQVNGLRSAAQALGTAEGAFDRALQHAKQREQFGKKLSQFQAIRHKLADMAVSLEGARWLTYKAALDYDRRTNHTESLFLAQLEAGRCLIHVVDEALQIFGGYGYISETAIEHYFRDAWAIGVELGT
ncbi:MAG: acyl-CoA/acyl-ACP dehydrogenase, partial [Syntrophaceae bacterium]|nr:acyl-CoA/acyl-ACP dehydrogenase [Syntrophaceae bacterium]